ncbi:uncharacterized protein LOC135485151 isoform X2 [Lineus longissimus]|uniref:uncharacterized protein LOC135485151 isoform X2 n=1 Tax=Lineus longissimus TaxID=88925 RepID=UPI002B4E5062
MELRRCLSYHQVDLPPTDEQVNEIREAFSLFDIENVGEITARELGSVLTAHGYTASEEALVHMLNDIDEDESGTIEFNEFCSLMSRKLRPKEQEEEIQAAFKAFDKDNDGYITAQELKSYMTDLGQNLSMREVEAMITEADEDQDGRISYNEFCKLISS